MISSDQTKTPDSSIPRCAVIGIVGRTNAGKSTLLNRIIGEKVSIVSPVAQTTRNTIRGILTEPRGQLVFLDTPGLHKAEGRLGTMLNRMARQASAGVDIVLVVFDGGRMPQMEDEGWMSRVCMMEQPVVFALNKADRAPFFETAFRDAWKKIQAEKNPKRKITWTTCSAVKAHGADDVINALFRFATPTENFLFDADIITDYPRKLAIADVVREKFLAKLHDEIPHELGILVDDIDERAKTWQVAVTLYVSRSSQKGIVIGPKGSLLKYVRACAEPELSEIFGVAVKLELWVKVEKDWMTNFRLLRAMGYAGSND